MFSVTLTRWHWKERPDGTAPIYVVVRSAGRRSTVSTGIYVKEKDWNDRKGEVRRTHPRHSDLNRAIRDAHDTAQDAADGVISDRGRGNTGAVADAVRGDVRPHAEDFIGYAEKRIAQYWSSGQFATAAAHRTAWKKFRKFVGGRVGFAEVTTELLRDFQSVLVSEYGNSQNTIHKNITCLRALYYDADRDGRVPAGHTPFRHLRLKKGDAMPRALSIDQFRGLERAELTGEWDRLARDMFVFAVYAGGMRFSDVCRMRHDDIREVSGEWRVAFRQKKTGAPSMVMLLPAGLAVAGRYGWPGEGRLFPAVGEVPERSEAEYRAIASANTMANKSLRRIAAAIGIRGRLTTHMARHTLANLLDAGGVSVRKIGGILGHSKAQTTEAYIKRIRGIDADQEMRDALG